MEPLIWPCLEKGKEIRREYVRERKRKREIKKRKEKKRKETIISPKDDTRSLDELKIERRFMQKLEKSRQVEDLAKN